MWVMIQPDKESISYSKMKLEKGCSNLKYAVDPELESRSRGKINFSF